VRATRGRWIGCWTAGVVTLLLAVPACTSPAPAEPLPAQPTSASRAPTAVPNEPNAQILGAYLGYWDAVIAAHRASNPRLPLLAQRARNPELTKVRQTVDRNRVQHISVRGTVSHRAGVQSVSGSAAVVVDCYDVSQWNPVDTRTGAQISSVEEGGTGRHRARYTLTKSAGRWIVSNSAVLGGC
jgi:hypothetical protein